MLAQIRKVFTESENPIKSESSMRNYVGHIHRLFRATELNNDSLFKDENKNKVLQFIDTRTSASTKNQIACALKKYSLCLGKKEYSDFCKKKVEETIAIRKGKKEKLRLIKKKKDNWICFKILKKRYELALEIVRFYHKLNSNITIDDNVQDYKDNLEIAMFLGLYLSDIKINIITSFYDIII